MAGESVSPSSSRFRDYGRVMQESREGLGSIALQRNAVEKKRELSVNKFNRQMDKHGVPFPLKERPRSPRTVISIRTEYGWKIRSCALRTRKAPSAPCQVGTPEYAAVADKLINTNRQGLLALDGSVHDPAWTGKPC